MGRRSQEQETAKKEPVVYKEGDYVHVSNSNHDIEAMVTGVNFKGKRL